MRVRGAYAVRMKVTFEWSWLRGACAAIIKVELGLPPVDPLLRADRFRYSGLKMIDDMVDELVEQHRTAAGGKLPPQVGGGGCTASLPTGMQGRGVAGEGEGGERTGAASMF